MKMIVCIISDDDAGILMDKLNEENFMATKISSTGGFLRSGNTTMMIGVKESDLEFVLGVVKENCKGRTVMMPPRAYTGSFNGFAYTPPVEVEVGGATVFVLDVEQFHKY